MAAVTAEAQVNTDEFFAELNKGQRFIETMLDGRTVELYLQTPHIENVLRASDLFDALDADLEDKETIRGRLMSRSCIHGVNGENVVAFLSVFPPIPRVVIACGDRRRVERPGGYFRKLTDIPDRGIAASLRALENAQAA